MDFDKIYAKIRKISINESIIHENRDEDIMAKGETFHHIMSNFSPCDIDFKSPLLQMRKTASAFGKEF